jgi:hypothetical protein
MLAFGRVRDETERGIVGCRCLVAAPEAGEQNASCTASSATSMSPISSGRDEPGL